MSFPFERYPIGLIPACTLRLLWTLRSLRPFRPFRSLRPFHTLRTVWPVHLNRAGILSTFTPMLPCYLISAIEAPQFSTGIGSSILTAIFLSYITGLRYTIVVPPAAAVVAATPRATAGRSRPTVVGTTTAIGRTRTAVVATATIAASIVRALETESVELRLKTSPLRLSQLRLINPFDAGAELPFFPSDPCPKIVAAKCHVPLRTIGRRNRGRDLSQEILIRVIVEEQGPLLCFGQRYVPELNFLHTRPSELRLDHMLERLDVYCAGRGPRQRAVDFHLATLNRLRPDWHSPER